MRTCASVAGIPCQNFEMTLCLDLLRIWDTHFQDRDRGWARRCHSSLVLHAYVVDLSAVDRRVRGTVVWKSVDDGETWSDEIGDIITIPPGPGFWYEKDLYFVTTGEGVSVTRRSIHCNINALGKRMGFRNDSYI